ncbi:ABC transporter substrate-binding protein [Dactylosporangium fulvum]|uniref:Extracellular solute-binding protein n=1 Tax=Dactylosporangium fulvum TaxID=53359 RepID=A0ABY5VSC7_9ACTN|nr:extracellular solute-binding protein [Dactylosporangium fulvum]UWP80090.1 extracellular solute-binding protein [Dactylosporangium fulvum]
MASDDTINSQLIAAFEKKYPEIKVTNVKLISSDQAIRLDQELTAGKPSVDILLSNSDWKYLVGKNSQGLLGTPQGPDLASYPADDLSKGIVPISINPYVIMYNTKELSSAPSYSDLLDPKFKGRLGVPNVPTAVAHQAEFINLRSTLGDDYLGKLAAQGPRIDNGFGPTAQSIGSGELLASPAGVPSAAIVVKAKGAPIDYVIPKEGTVGFTYYAAALKTSPHPNAGLLFLNFVGTVEAQQILNGEGRAMSVLPNVPGTVQDPDHLVKVIDWSKLTDAQFTEIKNWWGKTFVR